VTPSDSDIDAILRIAYETSSRSGNGFSMDEALRRTCYRKLRNGIDFAKILAALHARPQAVHDWVMYSADKRSSGGWTLDADGFRIGRRDHPNANYLFASLPDAVAAFVLHELDYWSGRATESR
jgi:hypothetical protein